MCVLSGLVRVFWHELSTLWTNYCTDTNANNHKGIGTVRLSDTKERVRQLHAMRHMVLPRHQERYFYDDPEAFISTASFHQMQRYIRSYQPVITASMRQAQKQGSRQRTLTTFHGFTTRLARNTAPRLPSEYTQEEEPTHRKRNRLKDWMRAGAHLLRGFLSKPQPPT
jgi:hypothetical protein